MRVLITNNALAVRAGSELYVRDLATGLLDRGITPIVYSLKLGEVADELRQRTVPVIDDLDSLGSPPDLIHGQHHLETMTALLRFPGIPAVYFCHGWLPWQEAAPRFPRILRYVAVDETCRDRLVCEHGIPEDRVHVVLNFVDLERFKLRGPLPGRPARALAFSNYVSEGTYLGALREACEQAGISLDVLGLASGNSCANPEEILASYDLVFAKARAAIEALAVGTAVVLCDAAGAGEMVTTANFNRLRPLNFGIRALREPVSSSHIAEMIARYDAEDAAAVSRRVRAEGGRDAALDEIVSLYRSVLEQHAAQPRISFEAESRAASAYLRSVDFRVKESERIFQDLNRIGPERDRLREERDHLREERDRLRDELAKSEASLAKSEASLAAERLNAGRSQEDPMADTLGWRLLTRYGRFKYRFLRPAYHRLKRLFRIE